MPSSYDRLRTLRPALPFMLAVAGLAGLAAALAAHLDVNDILVLRDSLRAFHAAHPATCLAAYTLAYIAMTALSVPGAVFLTLAGGAAFGFWPALGAVTVASTTGASLAFLGARHLFRQRVATAWGDRLHMVDEGIARNGPAYLLGLRLAAVVPYWLVNLLCGVTAMRLSRFALVSLVGMVPLNAVYIRAGTELGNYMPLTGTAGDATSPVPLSRETLILLFIMGVLPPLFDRLRRRKRAG